MIYAKKLMFQRLREIAAETMRSQKDLGGKGFVVVRCNGSVLSRKTGTFEYNLEDALEVQEEDSPSDFGGNKILSKQRARVEVIKALGQQAVRYDKTLRDLSD